MYLRILLLSLLFLSVSVTGQAQGLLSSSPESVGISTSRLERIDRVMQKHVDGDHLAGASALIYRKGEVAYVGVWGQRDREKRLPMTENTVFRIASMTKPVTSVAIMMLYEEGRFLLDDPVSRYLPEFEEMEVLVEGEGPRKRQRTDSAISVQDLLRHTSGLTYGTTRDQPLNRMYRERPMPRREETLAENIRGLAEFPLMHQPGTAWEYSLSVDVLGRLVEVLSGMSLDQFFSERIFTPLGMIDTGFYVPQDKHDRLAQRYNVDDDLKITLAPAEASALPKSKPIYFSGGAGLVSTLPDYLRFSRMLLGGGEMEGVRLLSPRTVKLMTANHLGSIPVDRSPVLVRLDLMKPGYGFGLGFAVARDPAQIGVLTSVGEYNWGGAVGTRFWIDPEEELIGIFMTQISGHPRFRFATEFQNLVYQALID